MAKQYKVLVNSGKQENNQTVDVQQFSGDKGQPVRIKARAGAKYQLQEIARGKPVGPDYVKVKRVGKDLHILFENENEASLIIEGYYSEMAPGYNGVIGQAENGSFYEYIPEDPRVPGLIPELAEGGRAVNVALGGAEVTPVGAALGVLAFNPLMGILGLGAIGAVAAAVDGQGSSTATQGVATGKLDSGSDSGVQGDNKTNNATPTMSGTVPTGATAEVTINGQKYPVTVKPDGTWSFTTPTNLPDGTYYPILHVTQNGVTKDTNITPFTIDTTAPTIAISSNAVALAANQTATITFTLSEASSDFTAADITVTGGSLGSLTQSASDPKVYTALFTPSGSGTSASISVGNGRFSDAAANFNADGAEANNTVNITTNASITGDLTKTSPNDSGVTGDNITNNTKPSLNGKVPAGSTASVTLNGQKYPVTVNPDGTWSFTNPTNLPDGTYTPVLDVVTNGQTSSTPLTPFTIDTTPPTIVVTSAASVLAAGQNTSVTFTLSEAANDFAQEDITVTGGTLSNFQKSATDPKIYTATFIPSDTGTSATISVVSAKFSDAAANLNADGAEANNTVSLTTNATSNGQLSPVSDNSTGTPNDGKTNDKTPELSGKVPAGSTATVTINGQTYPVTVKPDGTWSFTQPTDLPDGTYTPQLNVITNGQSSSTPITPFTIDTTPPTVAITGGPSTLVAGQSTTLTLTLSEASTDLTDADLVVAGGKLGPLQQSATNPLVYTATFTAGSGSTASVSIGSDKFADAAGNLNKDGAETNNSWSAAVTPSTPASSKTALSLDPIAGDNIVSTTEGASTTYTVTGKVTGTFAAGDLVTLSLNGKSYTAVAAADSSFSTLVAMADLKADAATKITGSVTGTGGDTATAGQDYVIETASNAGTQTALSIDPITADNNIGSAEATGAITLTGKVTGKFSAGDTVSLVINGKTFTGLAAANGSYSIAVPAADLLADSDSKIEGTVNGTGGTAATAFQDYGTNASINPAPAPTGDTTPPTILVERTNPAASLDAVGTETILFTLSEASTTFDASDIAVTGGTLGNFTPVATSGTAAGGYTKYTAVFTPTAGATGTATIGVASARFADMAGNLNQDTYLSPAPTGAVTELATGNTNLVSVAYDTRSTNPADNDKPTVQVSIDKTTLSSGQTATLTFILSESSTNFALADIDVISGGGTVSNLLPVAGSNGVQYTATYTAGSTAGTVLIGVDSAKFTDATGNANADTYKGSAAGTTAVTNTTAEANNWVQLTNTGASDTTAPTVVVTRSGTGTVGASGETIVFTLSEASTDFVVGDVAVTGGALSNWVQISPTQYSATFVPTAGSSGAATIGVLAGKFSDAASNQNKDTFTNPATGTDVFEANNQVVLSYDARTNPAPADTTAPTIAITADKSTLAAGQTASITFTLSEASSDFTNADIVVTGGTLSNITGSGTTYTATFTPTAGSQGTGSIRVDSNAFRDAASNYNQDGADANNTVNFITNNGVAPADTTPPTIAISSNQASLGVGQTALITFTMSEVVNGFVWDHTNPSAATNDIVVTGGTLGALTQSGSDPKVYTATFTPTANSTTTATISVANGKFTDAAGLANLDTYISSPAAPAIYEANNQVSLSVNTVVNQSSTKTALSIDPITGDNLILASENTGNITITGRVTGTFAAGDTVTLVINGTNYTAQAAANGSYSVSVPATDLAADSDKLITGSVSGTGGDNAIAAQQYALESTNTPTKTALSINPVTADNIFLASEATNGNVAITGKVTGVFATGDVVTLSLNGNTYSGTAAADGSYSINVLATDLTSDSDTQVDGTVNGTGGTQAIAIQNFGLVDQSPPTVAITRASTGPMTGAETITFTLSEASSDFTSATIDVTGGSLGTLTQSNTNPLVYTATFTPTANFFGSASVGIKSAQFRDLAGNLNADTYVPFVTGTVLEENNQISMSVNTDTTAPTIQVQRLGSGTVTASETITFTVSEATTSFDINDIVVSGGTLSNFAQDANNPLVYSATFTPTANSSGTASVGVRASKFTDAAGNNNADDFTLTGGANNNAENNNNRVSFAFKTDNTLPTIAITGPSGNVSGPSTITFTLSEASSDFELADINVTGGGAVTNLIVNPSNPLVYTATYTPPTGVSAANGSATISVASNRFSDAAGNFNADGADANNSLTVSYDTVTPTVAIVRSNPSWVLGGSGSTYLSETITFTLSEASTDFAQADVTLSSGSLSNWTAVSSTVYTATFTPDTNVTGTATIGVAAGKFKDAAGNLNADTYVAGQGTNTQADNQVSVAYDTVAPTATASFSSMTKDSGSTAGTGSTGSANWTTTDASAGRLLSGFVSAPLGAGEAVQVWVKTSSGAAVLLGTATVNPGSTTWAYTDTTNYVGATGATGNTAGWTYTARVVDAVGNSGTSADRNVTLNAVTTGSTGADATANTITYAAGDTVAALGGNDAINVTANSLQSDLVAGGFIDGGAGIDTIKLAANTTLSLQTLTANQTVQKVQEVEVFQMQGGSSLTMSANNVLSLGGANASTMTPYTFATTQQVADGSVAATGSTSSAGKVQMVVQGLNTDTLKLEALANDGVSSAGVFGNTGLSGNWAYMGQVQIGLNTFKVYNHSTTNAQVLVDVPVVVNIISPIKIVSIVDSATTSSDTGSSANDFTTNDNTLTYSGTVPVEFNPTNQDVWVEILNSTGTTVIQSGYASVTSTNWKLNQTSTPLADGNYIIRSTIVDKGTTTPTASFGSLGRDVQPLVIDTAVPTIAVTRAGTTALSAGQTDTITFTLSDDATDFVEGDISVTGGTLSNFSGSGKVYTATFTPNTGSGTATISVASSKFSDKAGNLNNDGAEANNTISVPYTTQPPQQTVSFSSMTKDSGLATTSTANKDWLTGDGSAGRLVSGTVSAALTTGQKVEVFANGTSIGYATVAGQAWEITDLNAYNASWTYTANVVDAAGNAAPVATQVVNLDTSTLAAPVITSVGTDATFATVVAHNGSTSDNTLVVKGTGVPGSFITLYDNTSGFAVKSGVLVNSSGEWTADLTSTPLFNGTHNFFAVQSNAQGVVSPLSNQYTASVLLNLVSNGSFESPVVTAGTYGTTLSGSNLPGWTISSGSVDVMAENYSYGGLGSSPTTPAGAQLLDMDGVAAGTIYQDINNLVVGQTYAWSFAYAKFLSSGDQLKFDLTGAGTVSSTYTPTLSTLTTVSGTFVATTSSVRMTFTNINGAGTADAGVALDNVVLSKVDLSAPTVDGSLTAGATLGTGNDTITATRSDLQNTLTAGALIDGGAGVDTLKLAAGTTLDLTALTGNQTVKPIEQVEVFELQGSSALTLSANNVLSLGGTNTGTTVGTSTAASPMAPYSFASTTGVTGVTTSSANKVQMVVTGTTTDALNLNTLALDGVTTNGVVGNTGLGGEWVYKGTAIINNVTYKVYDHSTSSAQVLTNLTASTESAAVGFTSMTKDSSLVSANADWYTADGSAGRLVSGTLAEPLPAGGFVKIYANGTLLGNATVNAARTAWAYTDTAGYSANWEYRADVVTSSGTTTASAAQQVFLIVDPTITSVLVDSYTTSNTTENFSNYTAGSTVGPNFTITGRNGAQAGSGGSGALFSNTNDLLGGGMAIHFAKGQNQNALAVGEILITKNTGDMYSLSFQYTDLQFGAKTIKLYAADGSVVNTFTLAEGAGTFSTGLQTQPFTSIGISGGNQDFWIMDNFSFAVPSVTAGGQVSLAANSTFLDTTPVLQGTTGRALAAGETIRIFDGATDLGAATVTGTNWTFNTTLPTGSTKTYTASIVSASGQVLQTSAGFTATQSGSASLTPTSNLPTSAAETVAYTGSTLDALGGNDTITAGTNVQTLLAAGGIVDGDTGVDTLKLAAGTTLDVTALTNNQTVKSIQQVEVFELQGSSTLTLSANNVLSLGQTNAFGTASTKVQLMVNGLSGDTVVLKNLTSDGVGGNAGLTGMWSAAGTTTVNSVTYNVYNHSTTNAQVLIKSSITAVTLETSPLVLDLDGDGIETTTLAAGAVFDLDANGQLERAAWVAGGDGLLVRDLDGNGLIDNGAELFGSGTTLANGQKALDGFAALAGLDSNGDGVINSQDGAFAQLQVWVDANGDGQTDAGELRSLASLGIASLGLHAQASDLQNNGNIVGLLGSYTTTDGTQHTLADVWLQNQSLPTLDLTQVLQDGVAEMTNTHPEVLRLNVSDVLQLPTNASGQHVLQVQGDANDLVSLSNLLADGHATGTWGQSGTVTQNGHTYNVYQYSGDASLQVLIDQHIAQTNVHVG